MITYKSASPEQQLAYCTMIIYEDAAAIQSYQSSTQEEAQSSKQSLPVWERQSIDYNDQWIINVKCPHMSDAHTLS